MLSPRYITACPNEELKNQGFFFVKRSKSKKEMFDLDFKAVLEEGGEDILAELNANKLHTVTEANDVEKPKGECTPVHSLVMPYRKTRVM